MKILLTMNLPYTPAHGGANKSSRCLLEGLARREHSVEAVVPALATLSRMTREQFRGALAARGVEVEVREEADVFQLDGVTVHAVAHPSRMRSYLAARIQNFAPDWVIVSTEDPSMNLLDAALKTSPSRVIYLAQTTPFLPFGPQAFFPNPSRVELLKQAAAILSISSFLSDYMKRWGGLDSHVIRLPVYGPGPFPNLGRFGEGFVTMINPCALKGVGIFLELARRMPGVEFAAVPTWGTTDSDREALGRLPNVRLLEPADDIAEILSRTRVLLSPSMCAEGFGLIVVEAMLRGIPVLASDVGGASEAKLGTRFLLPTRPVEYFTDELDGSLIPVPVIPEQDLTPWRDALESLLTDRALYEEESASVREAAHAFVSQLSIAPLEELLQRLGEGPRDKGVAAHSQAAPPAAPPQEPRAGQSSLHREIAGLTPEQRALLARRLKQKAAAKAGGRVGAPTIEPAPRDRHLPLSFAQQRLWFIHQLNPNGATYNMPIVLRLTGGLDVGALARAVSEVIRRHEVLRTTFPMIDGQPVQIINPAPPPDLPVRDLQGLDDPEAEARRLMREEVERPFDLGAGPLLRTGLLRLGDEEHVLLMTMHHIVSDGWSMGVLLGELSTLYSAYAQGLPSPLPEPKLQYADFAVWQRELLSGEVLEKQLSYWREQLRGAATLELPTDHARPAVQTFRGAHHDFELPREVTAALKESSRAEGATLFMTLLAAFEVLLARYSGQRDVSVGTPVAGRNRAEVEGLVGFFVNTLVIRARLSDDPPFREAVGRVREACLGAYAHQDVPFERLVEELSPGRDLSRPPLFQVLFAFQNMAPREAQLTGLTLTPVDCAPDTAKFDLSLGMEESEGRLRGSLTYNSDLFEAETAGRLVTHFTQLLAACALDPGRRVSELPLMSEGERRELLAVSNEARKEYAVDRCMHELFEEQARLAPDAVALTYEGHSLTYGELNARANRLAHYLRRQRVAPESRVGVCLGRSIEMMVGILGVLKAGGAYVPLDPDYPRERLGFILGDAGVNVLLTSRADGARLPETDARVICLDGDREAIARESDENPESGASVDNLAYVIYTSGSTGRPKGVMVAHRQVARLLSATRRWFDFSAADAWTLFHSFAFDFSVWEMWGALAYGGRLVVVPYMVSRSPEEFRALLERERVTVLNQTPSAFRQLMRAEEAARSEGRGGLSLRAVVFGGEALEPLSLRPWFEGRGGAGGGPRLVNMYGITETTVHVTYRPMSEDDLKLETTSVIGEPIDDLRFYVLDAQLQLVPRGVSGELYVGGDGLARGYLNRPALTAERFIPDPLSAEPGARLYRTGDAARRLGGGEVEYLGRLDQQVKVRGFRIELGEIDAALSHHAGVRESAVVAMPDPDGGQRLVAYVVAAGEPPAVFELRRHLKERLPDYMVPAQFVFLGSLPLTANGKLDRRALPEPGAAGEGAGAAGAYAAPRTEAEQVLASVWAGVLGVARVGIYDNFFELGGDSIRSIQILTRCAERGLNVTLQQLFRHQTVAELARELSRGTPGLPEDVRTAPFSLIPEADRLRMPDDIEDAYPLAALQAGMLFHMDLLPDALTYHNVDSFHLQARYSPEALDEAVRQTVARHPMLRTSFNFNDYSEPLQLVHKSARMSVGFEDISHLSEDEQEQAILDFMREEGARAFDLARPPQLRFHLHRRSDDGFQFTLTENHAIFDGWSLHSTLAEIFGRYFAILDGAETPDESPVAFTYRDFVHLERQALESEECREFWRERLKGYTPVKLPRWPASERDEGGRRFQSIRVPVTKEVSDGLKQVARQASVPIKSVLLAAHLKVMSLLGAGGEPVSGLVTHGRPETADAEQTRGLFLNTIPVRLSLGNKSWAELIKETFKSEWEALPYRRYPFAAIQRDNGGATLFESLFNYVQFHVVDELLQSGNVEVLDFKNAESTNYPLLAAFNLTNVTSNLMFALGYDARELCGEQVELIGRYYLEVFRAMIDNPSARHDASSLLPAEEQRRLLAEWNDTAVEYAGPPTLHGLFEEQAGRTPDAVAVIYEGERVSYGELDARANQLARHLRAQGVGPESVVGVLAERSAGMVVALLGVLKAGGAYLPLDPAYPAERLRFMVEDSGAGVVVATEGWLLDLAGGLGARVVCPERDGEQIARLDAGAVQSGVTADNLAYVIYTSGSTGRPKGVMVAHGGIRNRLLWMQAAYGLGAGDAVAQKTPFGFDVSVWEFFWPLLAGARLVVARPGGHREAAYLARLIEAEGVTVVHFVPSMLQVFLDEPEAAECRGVRKVFCSGEVLPYELQERFFAASAAELHNLYGPTEASVDVTHWACERGGRRQVVPIGRPIANTRAHVVGREGRPAPVGVAGELLLGGVGLARGYLNRPALTAERFIPDPFGAEPGARLYRTGDLARHLPGGEIEYLGRLDQQVKVRGFRIELGEIEAALSRHAGVRESAVVAAPEAGGGQRLVAYVVAAGEPPATSELRQHLLQVLPDYMVPAQFVFLGSLPLTANGKLDRRALPEPGAAGEGAGAAGAYAAPRTEAEQVLASVWAGVLGVARVGIYDNFFELGGHSLSATRIISRVREIFKIEFPMRGLFESETLEVMAAKIEAMRQGKLGLAAPAITPVARDRELPLSFAQQRLWFLEQMEPGTARYNLPMAVRFRGALDIAALERSLNELVRRHEVLRTRFPQGSAGPVQAIDPAGSAPLPVIDLSGLPEAEREGGLREVASREARRPFDLARDAGMRTTLVRLGGQDHTLLLTMHHIVSDAWSLGLLVREAVTLYEAFSNGNDSPLAELPVQYADYAVWQRGWLQGPVMEAYLSYWKRQLAGASGVLDLPADRPRPANPSYRGAFEPFELSGEMSAELDRLGSQEGATPFMTLLAVFSTLLGAYSNQEDVIVGCNVANRNWGETEDLIGFFVNVLPVRTTLAGDPTFREFLRRVREASLDAYAHQDLPFDKLVAELVPERDASRPPLVQVIFNFQNTHKNSPQLSDVDVDFFDVSETPANIDLTLNVENTGHGMRGQVLYSTDLFKGERITRLIGHFQLLLGAVLRDPEVRLGALRLMLAEAERARLAAEQEEFQRRKRRTLRGRSPEPVRGTGVKGETDYEQPAV